MRVSTILLVVAPWLLCLLREAVAEPASRDSKPLGYHGKNKEAMGTLLRSVFNNPSSGNAQWEAAKRKLDAPVVIQARVPVVTLNSQARPGGAPMRQRSLKSVLLDAVEPAAAATPQPAIDGAPSNASAVNY